MSIDNIKYFKHIDDIGEYVKAGLKAGTLNIDEVAKFARIHARQGELGQEVVTRMSNGLEETRNTVKADEKTGNPGWIVTNPNGEEYIVEDSTFMKKYELDPENPTQYKPKGGPVLSTPVDEHIEFNAPWGETMKIEAGGSLILSGPSDIYGIQKAEFEGTYASTGKSPEECTQEAIDLMGISKEEIESARQAQEIPKKESEIKTEKHIEDK